MESSKINEWLQIAGTIGVILSLVFVGLQLRQNQEIALSDIYQNRAQMAVDIAVAQASTPEFTSAQSKLYRDEFDKITPSEAIALEFFFAANIRHLENHHFQYQAGYLSLEHWQRNLDGLVCTFSLPYHRNLLPFWEVRASFQKILDDAIEKANSDPGSCWDFGPPSIDQDDE